MGTKVHLGCGKRFMPGYVHVDLSTYPHVKYIHDIKTLPMFSDNSVELIYASHTLEYFDRVEVLSVLQEWKRVLQFGGILRLAVPDFSALLSVYSNCGDLNRVVGPLYGRWEVSPGIFLYHKTVYDFVSLKRVLESAGFVDPVRWNWSEIFVGELDDFDDYSRAYVPHMDIEHGKLISLNVQCRKDI